MTPEMNFSKREKEILKWTAEGKTSAEIAMIRQSRIRGSLPITNTNNQYSMHRP
ncbi:LuxR C-terminal-related transcriptional regulator [Shigella flexneri]